MKQQDLLPVETPPCVHEPPDVAILNWIPSSRTPLVETAQIQFGYKVRYQRTHPVTVGRVQCTKCYGVYVARLNGAPYAHTCVRVFKTAKRAYASRPLAEAAGLRAVGLVPDPIQLPLSGL